MIIPLQRANKYHIISGEETSVFRFSASKTKFVVSEMLIETRSHGPFLLFLVLVSYIFKSGC